MGLALASPNLEATTSTSNATGPATNHPAQQRRDLPSGPREVILVEADSNDQPTHGPPSALKKRTKSVEFDDDVQLVKKPSGAVPGEAPKVLFGKNAINNHGLVPLSKYWDKALRDFDTYIPLSVFDPTWLRQDLLEIPIKKKTQKEKSEE